MTTPSDFTAPGSGQPRSDQPAHVGEGTGQVATSRVQPATATGEAPAGDPKNPLGEETIKVRVRPGIEFFHMGDLVREGDEFDMPISQARAASAYIDEVAADGVLRSVPSDLQKTATQIKRASLVGMARHERIGTLEDEKKQLEARLEQVNKQLAHENELLTKEQAPPAPQPAVPTRTDQGANQVNASASTPQATRADSANRTR